MAPAVIVSSASSLKHICDGSFPEIFISNINNIYAHEDSDINKILESKKNPMLKKNVDQSNLPVARSS